MRLSLPAHQCKMLQPYDPLAHVCTSGNTLHNKTFWSVFADTVGQSRCTPSGQLPAPCNVAVLSGAESTVRFRGESIHLSTLPPPSCPVVPPQAFPPLPDAPTELIPLVSYAPDFGSKSFYSHDAPSSDYDYSSQADDVNLDDVTAMEAESSGPLLTHRGPAATSSSSGTPRQQQLLLRQQQGMLRQQQQQQQALQQQRGVGAVGPVAGLSRGNGGGVVAGGGTDVPLGAGS
jgi:hypothetical protein